MFLLFVAYVPCVYLLARRFAPPLVALLAAAFAVAWGPATYPAAVPSWYLLFFSVFGALALVRYLETRQMRWLVVGGLFGGLAITFKIVGVWYVLAVLFFLVFLEQEGRGKRQSRVSPSHRVWAPRWDGGAAEPCAHRRAHAHTPWGR